jgi:general secretion pathway protein N
MSRRLLVYLALGGIVYAAVLVALLPASVLSGAIERATKGRLSLRDPQGTAWDGSARLYARQTSGALVDLGALRWKANAGSLFRGSLAAEVTKGDGRRIANVRLSPATLTLQGLDVQFPGSVLAGVDPVLATLGPEGQVRVRSDELRIEAHAILGLAEVELRGVRLARAKHIDFGSHLVRLRGGGEKVGIELGTLSGPLQLKGGGTWDRRGALDFSGSAQASNPDLAAFLKSVCAEYREQRCAFRYSRGL